MKVTSADFTKDDPQISAAYDDRAVLLAVVAALLPAVDRSATVVLSYSDHEAEQVPVLTFKSRLLGEACYHINPAHLHRFQHISWVSPADQRASWDHSHKPEHHRRWLALAATVASQYTATANCAPATESEGNV